LSKIFWSRLVVGIILKTLEILPKLRNTISVVVLILVIDDYKILYQNTKSDIAQDKIETIFPCEPPSLRAPVYWTGCEIEKIGKILIPAGNQCGGRTKNDGSHIPVQTEAYARSVTELTMKFNFGLSMLL
jgi:hypothetical protein